MTSQSYIPFIPSFSHPSPSDRTSETFSSPAHSDRASLFASPSLPVWNIPPSPPTSTLNAALLPADAPESSPAAPVNAFNSPHLSWKERIKMVILDSPNHLLKYQEICKEVCRRWPHLDTQSTKTTIRHHLSHYPVFENVLKEKVPGGRGAYWTCNMTRDHEPPHSKRSSNGGRRKQRQALPRLGATTRVDEYRHETPPLSRNDPQTAQWAGQPAFDALPSLSDTSNGQLSEQLQSLGQLPPQPYGTDQQLSTYPSNAFAVPVWPTAASGVDFVGLDSPSATNPFQDWSVEMNYIPPSHTTPFNTTVYHDSRPFF